MSEILAEEVFFSHQKPHIQFVLVPETEHFIKAFSIIIYICRSSTVRDAEDERLCVSVLAWAFTIVIWFVGVHSCVVEHLMHRHAVSVSAVHHANARTKMKDLSLFSCSHLNSAGEDCLGTPYALCRLEGLFCLPPCLKLLKYALLTPPGLFHLSGYWGTDLTCFIFAIQDRRGFDLI